MGCAPTRAGHRPQQPVLDLSVRAGETGRHGQDGGCGFRGEGVRLP